MLGFSDGAHSRECYLDCADDHYWFVNLNFCNTHKQPWLIAMPQQDSPIPPIKRLALLKEDVVSGFDLQGAYTPTHQINVGTADLATLRNFVATMAAADFRSGQKVGSATASITNGIHSWWTHPFIAETNNDTWVGVVDDAGDIKIVSLTTGVEIVLDNDGPDDHNAPSVFHVDGKPPLALWTRHIGGLTLYWKKGTTPGDFSTLGETQTKVAGFAPGSIYLTYTQVFHVPGTDTIYVFSRRDDDTWVYFKSDDYGDTFGDYVTLFDFENVSADQGYLQITQLSDGVTLRIVGGFNPSASLNGDIHYFTLNLATGALAKADGTSLGNIATDLPLTRADVDIVWDESADATYSGSRLFFVGDGPEPEVAFMVFSATADSLYRYARWDGTEWVIKSICGAGAKFGYADAVHYNGGMAIPRNTTGGSFIIARELRDVWFVERWDTDDNGDTWNTTLLDTSSNKLFRPICFSGFIKLIYVEATFYGDDYDEYTAGVRLRNKIDRVEQPAAPTGLLVQNFESGLVPPGWTDVGVAAAKDWARHYFHISGRYSYANLLSTGTGDAAIAHGDELHLYCKLTLQDTPAANSTIISLRNTSGPVCALRAVATSRAIACYADGSDSTATVGTMDVGEVYHCWMTWNSGGVCSVAFSPLDTPTKPTTGDNFTSKTGATVSDISLLRIGGTGTRFRIDDIVLRNTPITNDPWAA